MTNKKISALTAATLPLAGTEVFPLVQSGSTVNTAVSNIGPTITATGALNAGSITSGFGSIDVGTDPISGGVGTFTSTFNWGTAGNRYMYGAGGTQRFAYTSSNLNALYSGGTSGLNIYDQADANVLVNVSDAGIVSVNKNNLSFGTAAKGINFTANTPAAGKTSQLLNWYEEGTWTPTFFGTGTAGSPTYTAQKGSYTRVGRVVHVTGYVGISAIGGMTGNLQIGGLPFTSLNVASMYGAYSVAEYGGLTMAAGNVLPTLESTINNTTIVIYNSGSSGGSAQQTIANTSASSYIIFSGFYFAA